LLRFSIGAGSSSALLKNKTKQKKKSYSLGRNSRLGSAMYNVYKMNDNNENQEEDTGSQDVQGGNGNNSGSDNISLTASQKTRIEKNRQAAQLLKQARLIPHPYAKM
jgi:Spy/CpxP family protein refolding chaperone